jgi:hypothetical protein
MIRCRLILKVKGPIVGHLLMTRYAYLAAVPAHGCVIEWNEGDQSLPHRAAVVEVVQNITTSDVTVHLYGYDPTEQDNDRYIDSLTAAGWKDPETLRAEAQAP